MIIPSQDTTTDYFFMRTRPDKIKHKKLGYRSVRI